MKVDLSTKLIFSLWNFPLTKKCDIIDVWRRNGAERRREENL
jgi:hypothetical protein